MAYALSPPVLVHGRGASEEPLHGTTMRPRCPMLGLLGTVVCRRDTAIVAAWCAQLRKGVTSDHPQGVDNVGTPPAEPQNLIGPDIMVTPVVQREWSTRPLGASGASRPLWDADAFVGPDATRDCANVFPARRNSDQRPTNQCHASRPPSSNTVAGPPLSRRGAAPTA